MKDHSITNLNIDIPEGMKAEVKIKRKGVTPGYWRIANSKGKHMNIESIDAFEMMSKLTPQEFRVINILKNDFLKWDDINEEYYASCHVVYEPALMNATEKKQFNTGVRRLIEHKLLVREKRKHYMFNPAFIIPTNYNKEEREWIELEQK